MMQSLRDNMKVIIWITAIIFLVGFGILELGGVLDTNQAGQAPSGIIAEINGDPIRVDEFMQTYNQMIRQLQQSRELQPGEDSYVREQAWQTVIRNALLRQEARKRGIEATAEEIKMAVRIAPPEFVTEATGFQTDGQFDYRKYLAELDNPNTQVPWAQVEAMVAASLPIQKLQEQVVAAAKVSEGDVRERFLLQNERIKIRFLHFAPDSFSVDTTRIGGADIEGYYKNHPEEFTGPEQVKIGVILVPRKPDESDFAAARERLRGVLDMARAQPDSFPSLARTYSEIQSAQRGGAPGVDAFVDDMRPIFRNGLKDVKLGQVSDILQEERSLHIFLVENRYLDPTVKRERMKYREIAIRVDPGPAAIRVARELVARVRREAEKDGFAATATRHGVRTFESDYFTRGQSGNDILERFPEVESWMFQAKKGSISRSVPSEVGWYLYRIVDRRERGVRPLSEMQEEAKAGLIRSLRMERAREAAAQAREAVLAGARESDAAAHFHGRTMIADGVTRNGFIGPIGEREPKVVGALFAMEPGVWSGPLTGGSGVYVAAVDFHTTPSEEEFRKEETKVRDALLSERRQVIYAEWMQDLRGRAKIKDYRENYFDA
jgi:parvulin-like peptidyl-prolyl isomerase